MELRYIRAFVAVAKHRSFTLAGEELFLTQSAVSQQIRALEGELGQTLFVRERNTVDLTAAGHTFLPEAQHVLEALERARAVVGTPKNLEGALRVAAATSASSYLYVGMFEQFAHAYPSVRLTIHTALGHAEAVRRVVESDADVAFVQAPFDGHTLEHELLGDTEIILIAPQAHRLAGEQHVKIETLKAKLLLWEPSDEVRRFLEQHGAPAPNVQTNDVELIKRLVASGFGLGFVPHWAVKGELEAGRFAAVGLEAPPLRQRFGVTYRSGERSATLRAFLHLCADYKSIIAEVAH